MAEFAVQEVVIKEEDRLKNGGLFGKWKAAFTGEVVEEGTDFGFAEGIGMAKAVKADESTGVIDE